MNKSTMMTQYKTKSKVVARCLFYLPYFNENLLCNNLYGEKCYKNKIDQN